MREHFRTASETIASHNANFVKQVREEYQVPWLHFYSRPRQLLQVRSAAAVDICSALGCATKVELSNSAKLREEVPCDVGTRRAPDSLLQLLEVKSFMSKATQSVESLELRVDEVASKAATAVLLAPVESSRV